VGAHWPGHAAMRRHGPLANGPCHLNFSPNFEISTKFVIEIGDFPHVQNSPNFQVDSLKHMEQLYCLDELHNPTRLNVINCRTNSNLNLSGKI
jgi:hypothetical protein